MKQWKRLVVLSSAIVMAAATLTYFPNDTLQNIRLEISASAETTTEPQVWIEDNLTWTLTADGTLNISGTGAMKNYDYDNNPSSVCSNSSVKKVVIEDGVTSIGDAAFYGCSSLTSITIPSIVTSIGNSAFDGCSSLTSITIPDSVTSIGDFALYGCSSLTSITIPDGVTSIGYYAFSNCSSLTSITIPDSVTNIGNSAFSYCSNLTSITIPNSVTSIGTYAFSNCWYLTSITIPDSVTSIGNSAFEDCSSLTSITIPKSVTSIGNDAFYGCNNLTVYLENGSTLTSNDLGVDESKIAFYYQWNEDNLTWTLDADGTLTISGTGAMKNYNSSDNRSPAYNNSNVKKVVIEDGVTSIGNSAFDSCSNLTSITIPNSVTSIGAVAFYGCSSLTSITIPDGVTSIGNWAFDSCSNLKTISLSCKSTLKKSNFSNQANLVSASHTLKKTAAKAATCAEDGNIEYWTCEHCGKYFLSDDINPETAKAVELSETVISASHKLTKVEAKAVTCAEDGNIEYWTCEHCGKYFLSDDTNPETAKAVELSETVIPALNHKNAIIQNASEPTETDPGYSGDRYCPDCDKVLEEGYTYWIEDNLTWKLYEDGTLTISGTGAMKNYNSDDNPSPAYWNTIVRKIVIEDGVTSIGKSAFSDCSNLTSITIPDSVTSIGNDAFYNCTSLTSITIPDSVTIIGDSAFFYCISLTNITLSNNITNIGNDAFYSCRSLTSITIPSSVTSIGNLAFYGCSSLTSITIPDSVTSIGDSAIRNCSSLTSITIPDSVTSIGYAAFYDCKNLKTISLSCKSTLKKSDFGGQADLVSYTPHTLTKTEAKAATCTKDGNKEYWICEHCKKYFLSDDTNPATATAVEQSECMIPAIQHKNAITRGAVEPTETDPGYSGDRYCPDCDTVLEKGYTYWNEGNLTWKLYEDGKLTISGKGTMKDYNSDDNPSPASQKKDSVKKVVIEDGVTSIGTAAFSGCGLISITIPNSVTSIENTAFSGCSSLTSITIPDSVTSIGTGAFSYCKSLTSITIPDSVTSIGTAAFSGCGLISITIPNSVTSIETGAFYNCSSLTSITIPDSVTSIGDSAFESCSSLTNITIPDSVTSIEDSAFESCSSLTNITIPDSVTSIGDSAFESCSSLTNITIPDSVTSIGAGAFYNCSSLTSITIPDSVTSIGVGAFYNCSSLTSITIPGGVTSIGMYAFYNCSSLTSITIPDSVTSIGMYAFSDCSSLTSITIPDSVTSIEESAFESCSSLTSITIPKSVTSIESGVFNNCNNLTVYLESGSTLTSNDLGVDESKIVSYHRWNEDNLTWKLYADGTLNISGTGAMKDYDYSDNRSPVYMNSSVKKIVIEDGVTSIGNWTFSDCSGLISITIPNSVASIGDWAFYYCTSLTTITIPDSVTSIGEAAFRFCSSLTSITIPDGVTSIGSSAFRGCTSLTSITIPDSITSIGNDAFSYCKSLTSITIPDNVTSIGEAAFGNCSSLTTISLSCKSTLKKSDFGDKADLVSYTSHTLKKTEAKAATCTEDGNKEYWTCEHCKKYFLSDDTNPETATAVELSETVIPALVQVATATTPIKCVYGQDMNKIDLRDYVKNTDVVGEVAVKVATGSTLPDGMKLDGSKLSGKPAKAYEDGREVPFTFTAENGSTENLTLLFLVAKADPTVEVAVSGDSHTEGDLVKDLELILSGNSTKGIVELVSEIKALVAGKNTLTWKFTPEDENNYHTVTGTVVVNAQTTTTTTTKATTTTTKATTTTKPNKTTTTNATTTTKPSKTTTTKATTTTKPSKTTTTNATTTTKPSKTTTTNATTTTKPSKTTTTKATTTTKTSKTTKPSKTTTTKVTTTTKPSKTTTTKVTTTTKPSKTTTTNATTTTKPSKTTTTNATTTTKPSKTTTTNATTTTKPSKTTTTNATTTIKPSKTTTTNATTTTKSSKTTTTKATTTNTAIPSYGDVNLDGKVDIVDAIFLNKYLATLIQFSDAQMANADCCQDGVLNDQDTTALMQFIILLIDDLPVQPTEK